MVSDNKKYLKQLDSQKIKTQTLHFQFMRKVHIWIAIGDNYTEL